MDFPEKLFVTGTDTDIGKTIVSSVLVKGLNAGYWKPVQAGIEPCTDTEYVKRLTGLNDRYFYRESYKLKTPMSPHASAKIDGVKIDLGNIKIPDFSQNQLIIEGAGGLIVPLNESKMIIDLIKYLDIPVLVVAKSGLGTLNHTLLSLMALRSYNISIFGVVMNGEFHSSNKEAIRKYGDIENIYQLPPLKNLNPAELSSAFNHTFS
jgi:dethiobiotin synthetase